jgi:hypothetical protein
MAGLEYRIGGLKIDPKHLKYEGIDPYDAGHKFDPYEAYHKFVVEAKDSIVSIYVIEAHCHYSIVLKQKVDENKLVGGGSFYLDKDGQLVLDNYSDDYGAIPKKAALRFAELILPQIVPELGKSGIQLHGIIADPNENLLNSFWKEKVF